MDNESRDKSPRPASRKSELSQAMLAVTLAVASQLAVRDGLALLGLAGYVTAALLFVTSVGAIFRVSLTGEPALSEPTVDKPAPVEAEVELAAAIDGTDKLRYLRRHWRLVTIAEIFAGDIPPARVSMPEAGEAATDDPGTSLPAAGAADAVAVAQLDAPPPEPAAAQPPGTPPLAAEMQSWTAAASPASTPKAIRVTAQGDVLVLNTGLEQVQRFDEQGNLLATYSLSGLAGVDVLDLDVSPDGQTLYIVDAASHHLRVITLVDEESTGGTESE